MSDSVEDSIQHKYLKTGKKNIINRKGTKMSPSRKVNQQLQHSELRSRYRSWLCFTTFGYEKNIYIN